MKKAVIIHISSSDFVDNFSANGGAIHAALHENSLSELTISHSLFSFTPAITTLVTLINSLLEPSDRENNGFIYLAGFNTIRFDTNSFALSLPKSLYAAVSVSTELQNIFF